MITTNFIRTRAPSGIDAALLAGACAGVRRPESAASAADLVGGTETSGVRACGECVRRASALAHAVHAAHAAGEQWTTAIHSLHGTGPERSLGYGRIEFRQRASADRDHRAATLSRAAVIRGRHSHAV